ncbi:hypothetical protein M409DRAFT_28867 [Zasmidium cellare ATCC 36951]|uniref:Methyltransferase domain-containing protein n=1 Tax=Zasmidium cellare ATCC 36951 TaxID=1080233 RepID=A0A6A6C3F9_ZASCE|nr:uncharacterized protein M409DRAFT_28867 [Zasmidium cellare ATCC 36951]KAF2160730.1 hypothetical protein M409DRAFT_28867 [Zasmidium cellare ATCC 36951]
MAHNQSADAQRLYDGRSATYDDSWHVRFARHMVEIASLQPGQKVLDLACGTGLVTFPAVDAVGSSGTVIGVDISSGMLAQAEKKLESQPSVRNVAFYQHSITDLDTLEVLKQRKGTFDLITCASALVLLPEPREAIKEWTSYLKPGGKLITDVTHVQSQLTGITYERVGRKLGVNIPWYRLNFETPEDFRDALAYAGLKDVVVKPIAQLAIEGTNDLKDYLAAGARSRLEKEYSIEDADKIFEATADGVAEGGLGKAEIREQAKKLFKEVWAKIADADGRVRGIDCVYVGVGTKP